MAELGAMPKRRSQLGMVVRALLQEPVALVGFAIVIGWLILAVLAPILPLEDPNLVQLNRKLQAPSWSHPFGTDDVGRDLVSRVIYASRVSVPAGMLVVLVTLIIGCTIGAIAGFSGGKIDSLIMRICDAVLSFPSIILAMAIPAARGGPGLSNAMIAIILVLWPEYARLMRGQVLTIKENEFVTAARSVGVSDKRVLFRHILPSTDAPIVVKATLDVGAAIDEMTRAVQEIAPLWDRLPRGSDADDPGFEALLADLAEARAAADALAGFVAGGLDDRQAGRVNTAILTATKTLVPANYTASGEFDHDLALGAVSLPALRPRRPLIAMNDDELWGSSHALRRSINRVRHAVRTATNALREVAD